MITQEMQRETPAVLYICADRAGSSGIGAERATEEGHTFAERNGLRIVEEIPDPYGEPVPWKRDGWARVRGMAENGEIEVAIVRYPNALSPEPEMRFPELDYLGQLGVQIRYSWAPLAASGGGAAL
ncbi:hypothetical protein [Streptomyces hygroscopicus]|uniref:hypothetical protein n=1 Tax=Streptomyces hygroscopicus TaxID=1912 RepID=UPI001FCC8996|nr:hypothetical protein [Streptomyces hygroscopicus]BDH10523.1 hypothetical protein HOK021_17020 [Streptomyces hygroscopicus]